VYYVIAIIIIIIIIWQSLLAQLRDQRKKTVNKAVHFSCFPFVVFLTS
jgi:hypothetical protein